MCSVFIKTVPFLAVRSRQRRRLHSEEAPDARAAVHSPPAAHPQQLLI